MASAATQTAKSKSPDSDPGTNQLTTPEAAESARTPAAVMDPSNLSENRNEQRIAQLAYSYWQARTGSNGSAEEDWFRAEAELYGNTSTGSE
jgi:Protein of unknown function (DUF2934)